MVTSKQDLQAKWLESLLFSALQTWSKDLPKLRENLCFRKCIPLKYVVYSLHSTVIIGIVCMSSGLALNQELGLTQSAFTCKKSRWNDQSNVWNQFKANNKDTVFVALLITLNICHALFLCSHCWFWTSKWWLGSM